MKTDIPSKTKRLKKLLLEDLMELLEGDFYDTEKASLYESIILSNYKDLCSCHDEVH